MHILAWQKYCLMAVSSTVRARLRASRTYGMPFIKRLPWSIGIDTDGDCTNAGSIQFCIRIRCNVRAAKLQFAMPYRRLDGVSFRVSASFSIAALDARAAALLVLLMSCH